jgi:hypothetical protein
MVWAQDPFIAMSAANSHHLQQISTIAFKHKEGKYQAFLGIV